MILAWWFFFAFLVATAVFAAAYFILDNRRRYSGMTTPLGLAALLLGFGAGLFLIIAPIISLSRHYGRISCASFADQSNRTTKFVIYTNWDTGDCLTPDGHGKWIPTKRLREIDQ